MTKLQTTYQHFPLFTLDTIIRGLRSDIVRGKKIGYSASWLERKAEILIAVEAECARKISG